MTAPQERQERQGRRVQAVLAAAALIPVAAIFASFFAGSRALVPLLGAVLAAAALAVPVTPRISRGDLVAAVGVLGGALYGLLALFPSRWGDGVGAVFSAFADAVGDGPARMLTVGLPADPTGDLLLTPAVLLWAASFAAVGLALRTDSVLLPALPSVGALTVALLTVAARGQSHLTLTGAFLVISLVLAALRASRLGTAGQLHATAAPAAGGAATGAANGATAAAAPGSAATGSAVSGSAGRRRRPVAGPLAIGVPVVLVIAVLGTAAAAALPVDGDDRFDPRDHHALPVRPDPGLNPLVEVKTQLSTSPADALFTVTVASSTGKLPVDRIRTAALGDFDGASWTNTGLFVQAGGSLPPAPGPAPALGMVRATATVVVTGLTGEYLPAFGQPTGISGRPGAGGTGFEPASGTLLAASPVHRGQRYEVHTEVPEPSRSERSAAVAATDPALARDLRLPDGLPPDLVQVAHRITATAASPYARLTAIERYLRDPARFPYDLSARPGHSYGVLARLLTSEAEADRRGYAEQHAAAFALLARIEGFPTRIAVGYLLDERASDGHGTFTVTTRQAHAWPEVALAGIGWVPFEPTDTTRLDATLPPAATSPTGGGTKPRAADPELVPPIVVPRLDPQGAAGGGNDRAAKPLRLALLVALVVVVLVPALIVGEKRRRRWRRRRSGGPARRIGAAWREVRDRVTEHGVARTAPLTPREVAGRVRALPGGAVAAEHVERLAWVLDATVYCAAEPDEASAARAWELAFSTAYALRRRGGLRARVLPAVNPRPLLPGRR